MEERVNKKLAKNYSEPLDFDLDVERPDKTLDIGQDGTWVSADPLGRILQLSAFHPKHGIVVAVPYEQFDGSRFRDQLYVRSYRTRMLEFIQKGRPGYGIVLKGDPKTVSIITPRPNVTNLLYRLTESGVVVSTSLVVHDGELVQEVTIKNPATEAREVEYELALNVSVNRASYGQLTEGGPIPLPKSENRLEVSRDGGQFTITNASLDAHLEGSFFVNDSRQSLCHLERQFTTNKPLSVSSPGIAHIPPNSNISLTARFRLLAGTLPTTGELPCLRNVVSHASKLRSVASDWKEPDSIETFIIRRTLDYIIGNCLMPVGAGYCAIVTDHVALPLGWNRDNYWQVRFMQYAERKIHNLVHPPAADLYGSTIRRAIKDHLNWVYRKAERPNGYWHRSYLVTGKPKDGKVFQLDQQLYPLIELCDFYSAYPHEVEFVRDIIVREPTLIEVLQVILSKADPFTGLVPTEESPGDDEIDYPYHFSTHVVLWFSLFRLSKLLDTIGAGGTAFSPRLAAAPEAANGSQNRCSQALSYVTALLALTVQLHHFLVRGEDGQPLFAYVTNGKGKYTLYHDGNDMPTLFLSRQQLNLVGIFNEVSSRLGTLPPPDQDEIEQAWRNTMNFAFSTRNSAGYCGGDRAAHPFGGLGSVHSSGAWTLGYFQEYVFARVTGDVGGRRDAWRRIVGAMQWDGSFAEAVDARTGRCASKAWFSWPGAMIAAALVDAREEEEEEEAVGGHQSG